MKKMNALFAALTLAVTALTPMVSSAANIEFKGDRNTMQVKKDYGSHYTLTIPDGLQTVDNEDGLTVKANAFLHYDEKLIVSVESNNGWELRDKNTNNKTYIPYEMTVDYKGEDKVIKTGTTDTDILEFDYNQNEKDVAVTMNMTGIGKAYYAGTYTDTLTFTARAEEIKEEAKATTASTEASTEASTPTETNSTTTVEGGTGGGTAE
ncbi:MAG: hypothetical protein NC340_06890 [Ruminococcus flavefaciens]|nr:hypothetical protein [Ruminococcus flavefaciens]MCM1230418.1 hypothetical protein [Ruminococcus flavefaciens]